MHAIITLTTRPTPQDTVHVDTVIIMFTYNRAKQNNFVI